MLAFRVEFLDIIPSGIIVAGARASALVSYFRYNEVMTEASILREGQRFLRLDSCTWFP